MSLTRTNSTGHRERQRRGSNLLVHRRSSFNPVSDWTNTKDTKSTETAGDVQLGSGGVSTTKRIVQVSVAVLYCTFATGTVFGYAALKPVLIQEGAFQDQCTKEELQDGVSPCYGQEIRLNLMFTVAAVSTNVAALPIGAILDRYGPRVCGLIGSLFLALGSLLYAFALEIPGDGFTPGYLFLALGGPFIYIPTFQLSNTFPQHSGLILAILTGAFDASSGLFLLFRLVYEATEGSFDTKRLFLIYLVVPVFIFIVQLLVMPRESYKSASETIREVEEEAHAPTPPELSEEERRAHRERRQGSLTEVTALLEDGTNAKRRQIEDAKNRKSGVWGTLHGHTSLEQIRTLWFLLVTLFTIIQMMKINYFVATIRPQERYLLGSEKQARRVNEFFDIALPLGGIISIPFVGPILDNVSTAMTMALLTFFTTAIGILGCLPYSWAAFANVCLFVVYRPFFYTAMSDYAAKVFGFQTFGKVYGLVICLAGLFNFVQSPLDAATHTVFKNNPIPINVILTTIAFVMGSILVVFVWYQSRSIHRERLEAEAEGATEVLMPDQTEEDHQNSMNSNYGT